MALAQDERVVRLQLLEDTQGSMSEMVRTPPMCDAFVRLVASNDSLLIRPSLLLQPDQLDRALMELGPAWTRPSDFLAKTTNGASDSMSVSPVDLQSSLNP